MAKTEANQAQPSRRAATRAFERAWKLLGKLEKRLAAARDEEAKRRRQLAAATDLDVARRQSQFDDAVAKVARVAALLTELSEMIAANARAQAGQTVSDVAHAAADAVRAEARARTAAGETSPRPRPVRSATPRTTRVMPKTAKPAAAKPAAAKPATARTATTRPAVKRPVTAKPPASPRSRPRRSLQPGQPDPDQSSS